MAKEDASGTPLVPERQTQQPQEPGCCLTCCRYLGLFFLCTFVGLLLGIGFSKGTVGIVITLIVLVIISAAIIYAIGWQQCKAEFIACFDIDQDGKLTCKDCTQMISIPSPEIVVLSIFGFIFGLILGLVVV